MPNTNIKLAGYSVSQNLASIVTLCDALVDPMIAGGITLASLATNTYGEIAVFLDDIVAPVLSLLLIRELSHTAAIMGNIPTSKNRPYHRH